MGNCRAGGLAAACAAATAAAFCFRRSAALACRICWRADILRESFRVPLRSDCSLPRNARQYLQTDAAHVGGCHPQKNLAGTDSFVRVIWRAR